jgi:hypothetical protein
MWLAAFSTACGEAGTSDGDHHDYAPEQVGSVTSRLEATDPVSLVVDSECGTAALMPLSTQLVEEIDCLSPGALVRFPERLGDGVEAGSSVFPFLQAVAVDSLEKVIAARGSTLHLNSGLRTLPQQFVLYRWYQLGRCGITLAATPGTSNHESGLAVDVQDNAGWRSFFLAEGWHWQGASDPVHYDLEGGVDLKGLSILAFQRVWNRNHPEDPIDEDGLYGAQTEARLTSSPIGGFPIGAVCTDEPGPGQGGGGAGGSGGNSGGGSGGSMSGGAAGGASPAGSGGTMPVGAAGTGGMAEAAGTSGAQSPAGASSVNPPVTAADAHDSSSCSVGHVGRSRFSVLLLLGLLAFWRRRPAARRGAALMGATLLLAGCSSSDDPGGLVPATSGGAAGSDAAAAGSVAMSGAAGSVALPSGGMPGVGGSGGASTAGSAGSAGTPPMVPDQCLTATASCENESQCCDGLVCDMTSLGQVCCGNDGMSCTTENGEDCCGDLLCIEGVCTSPFLDPVECEAPCKAPPALVLERHRLEDVIGGSWLGICGDVNHNYGYHLAAANLPASDYSLEGEVNEPVCEWYASAIDIGMDWPASRDWLAWLIEGIQTGRLQGIGEVIGSYDGQNVRYWSDSRGWSTEGVPYTGSGHDTWTHVSIHRSTALVDHRILAGWTAEGLEEP